MKCLDTNQLLCAWSRTRFLPQPLPQRCQRRSPHRARDTNPHRAFLEPAGYRGGPHGAREARHARERPEPGAAGAPHPPGRGPERLLAPGAVPSVTNTGRWNTGCPRGTDRAAPAAGAPLVPVPLPVPVPARPAPSRPVPPPRAGAAAARAGPSPRGARIGGAAASPPLPPPGAGRSGLGAPGSAMSRG